MCRITTIAFTTLLVAGFGASATGASSGAEATAAMRSGDFGRAAELLEQTIESSPPWVGGQIALAQCRFVLGQPERAETSLARALEIDADAPVFEAYGFAGMTLYGEKRYEEAIRPLEQALRHAPDAKAAPISTRLANALFQTGRYADAATRLREHLERFGFEAGMAYLLAVSQRQTGDAAASIRTMEKAVAGGLEGPQDARALERLAHWSAEAARAGGDPADLARALGHARSWRDRAPGNEQAFALWFDLAHSAGKLPEYDDALARLGSIESEYDASEQVVVALDQLDRARASLRAAVGKEPTLEARAIELNERIDLTETALRAALSGLRNDEDRIEVARDRRIRERCRVVHWNLKTDRAAVTEDDREFYDANDCRRRVLEDSEG